MLEQRTSDQICKEEMSLEVCGPGGAPEVAPPRSPSCLTISPTVAALWQYLEGGAHRVRSIYAIHKAISKAIAPPLEPHNLIPQLAQNVASDAKQLSIDYISLTRTCNDLLDGLMHCGIIEDFTKVLKDDASPPR